MTLKRPKPIGREALHRSRMEATGRNTPDQAALVRLLAQVPAYMQQQFMNEIASFLPFEVDWEEIGCESQMRGYESQ